MRLYVFFYILISVALSVCGQIREPLRNKIEFNDYVDHVADSILVLEGLLTKLPKQQVLSSFTDEEGFLFVNGRKIGMLSNALNDLIIRRDSVFVGFTDHEFQSFISISIYLLKNHIGYSMRDNLTGLFLHGYRETEDNSYDNMREIIVNADTTSPIIVKRYQILDRKNNVVLVAPIDAEVH